MKTLDKSKPYGTVSGPSDHAYEQDGHKFNGQGQQVDDHGKVVGDKATTGKTGVDEGQREEYLSNSKAELQAILTKRGIEFESNANKDSLVDLLIDADGKDGGGARTGAASREAYLANSKSDLEALLKKRSIPFESGDNKERLVERLFDDDVKKEEALARKRAEDAKPR